MKLVIPHRETLFTYVECHAQSESASRVHEFAHEPGIEGLVISYVRKSGDACIGPWKMRRLPSELSEKIVMVFDRLSLPLDPKVRDWNSIHFNRYLEVNRQGGSIRAWWDTGASSLSNSLEPLISLIRDVVEELKEEMAQADFQTCGDDLL